MRYGQVCNKASGDDELPGPAAQRSACDPFSTWTSVSEWTQSLSLLVATMVVKQCIVMPQVIWPSRDLHVSCCTLMILYVNYRPRHTHRHILLIYHRTDFVIRNVRYVLP